MARDVAEIRRGDDSWHDGPGWYFIDTNYPEEGSVGAFATLEWCIRALAESDYTFDPQQLIEEICVTDSSLLTAAGEVA